MSGNIGVKLDRMNTLLTEIIRRLPEPEQTGDDLVESVARDAAVLQQFNGDVAVEPKRRGWPKGKPRKVAG